MAANEQRRNSQRSLAIEPLEDRVLLSISITAPALARLESSVESAVRALTASPFIHQAVDARIERLLSHLVDSNQDHRAADPAAAEHPDKWEGFIGELREHVADAWLHVVRTEAEVVGLIAESPASIYHEPFAQPLVRTESEYSYLSASLHEPAAVAVDAAPLLSHPLSSLTQNWEAGIAAMPAVLEMEASPVEDARSSKVLDHVAPELLTAARAVAIPAGAIPLLNALHSQLPDPREAMEKFLARLSELGQEALGSSSSIPFCAWLAAAAVAAMETVRRSHASPGRRRRFLSTFGWLPPGSQPDLL
jgi:hypothetical protein